MFPELTRFVDFGLPGARRTYGWHYDLIFVVMNLVILHRWRTLGADEINWNIFASSPVIERDGTTYPGLTILLHLFFHYACKLFLVLSAEVEGVALG